jgi:hypothetical protein
MFTNTNTNTIIGFSFEQQNSLLSREAYELTTTYSEIDIYTNTLSQLTAIRTTTSTTSTTTTRATIDYFKNWVFEYRLITEHDRNQECPILLENIESNVKYCRCEKCQYNISQDALENHFKLLRRNCPMCRTDWTNSILYINVTKEEQQRIEKQKQEEEKRLKQEEERKQNTHNNKLTNETHQLNIEQLMRQREMDLQSYHFIYPD